MDKRYLTICTAHGETRLPFDGEPILLELLRTQGIILAAPCGGDGRCGGCAVRVRGQLSPADTAERDVLGERYAQGYRLACRVRLTGSAEINDNIAPISYDKPVANVSRGETRATDSTTPEAGDCAKPLCLAVDLGTTTVALRLFAEGRILYECAALNAQRSFGADVMTRIEHCRHGGLDELHSTICAQLAAMLTDALAACGHSLGALDSAVVAGNTTMLHLLAGIDPSPLGVAPYDTGERFGRAFKHIWAGLPEQIYLMPCVGGFTGGDLVAVLTALGDVPSGTAVCDLGTNGELALRVGDRWRVCSTAAGPALEGGGISCGTGSVRGAVSRIARRGVPSPTINAADLTFTLTADGQRSEKLSSQAPAVLAGSPSESASPDDITAGLTGAALLDLVTILLESGIIEPSGRMPCGSWPINRQFALTQADIRHLQLAKGAIAAGLLRLQQEIKITKLYITGGLGCRIDPHAAIATGLVPDGVDASPEYLPALALEGAAMCCAAEQRLQAERTAVQCAELALGGDEQFDRLFIECMDF